MDRRTFLGSVGAAAIAPAFPPMSAPRIGLDIAAGPDQTVIRLLAIQRGVVREVHRVTGIPRYHLGPDGTERDTWQDQVNAGLSEIIKTEST